jgi:hypothetical protein
MYGSPIQGKASITATASTSVTILAAVSGSRLHILKGFVSVITPAVGTLDIMEATAGGTSAATLFSVQTDSSNDRFFGFDFGEHGYVVSATGSRLIVEETADATAHCVFVGYHR